MYHLFSKIKYFLIIFIVQFFWIATGDYSVNDPTTCGYRNSPYYNRIVGGTEAEVGEFPWQVSIQIFTEHLLKHICGGAILNNKWVVTAGHCIWQIDPSILSIVAGDYNIRIFEGKEQRRKIVRTITNNFNLTTFTNDIALLELEYPLRLFENTDAAPICLPQLGQKFTGFATVSGWGRVSEKGSLSDTLQKVTLPLLDRNICLDKFQQVGYSDLFGSCQFCAGLITGGKDACQGDSGGPLICKGDKDQFYLCGIVSWGIGCAQPDYPGVYTEVACYVDWIKTIIQTE